MINLNGMWACPKQKSRLKPSYFPAVFESINKQLPTTVLQQANDIPFCFQF